MISSVGHHTDRTLLDDVAAVACSTPDPRRRDRGARRLHRRPRGARRRTARRLERQGRRAVLDRARTLARLSRAPVAPRRPPPHPPAPAPARAARGDAPRGRRRRAPDARHGRDAASARRPPPASAADARRAPRARRTPPRWTARRPPRSSAAAATWTGILATLAAHDPQRTLERGYALLEDPQGEPVTSAESARAQPTLTVRLHDGRVTVRPEATTRATRRRARGGETLRTRRTTTRPVLGDDALGGVGHVDRELLDAAVAA